MFSVPSYPYENPYYSYKGQIQRRRFLTSPSSYSQKDIKEARKFWSNNIPPDPSIRPFYSILYHDPVNPSGDLITPISELPSISTDIDIYSFDFPDSEHSTQFAGIISFFCFTDSVCYVFSYFFPRGISGQLSIAGLKKFSKILYNVTETSSGIAAPIMIFNQSEVIVFQAYPPTLATITLPNTYTLPSTSTIQFPLSVFSK